jgi:hypothetical protein
MGAARKVRELAAGRRCYAEGVVTVMPGCSGGGNVSLVIFIPLTVVCVTVVLKEHFFSMAEQLRGPLEKFVD